MGHGAASKPAAKAALLRKSRRVMPHIFVIAQVGSSVLICSGINTFGLWGVGFAIKSVFGLIFVSYSYSDRSCPCRKFDHSEFTIAYDKMVKIYFNHIFCFIPGESRFDYPEERAD